MIMKKILLFMLAIVLSSCGMSVSDIERETKELMVQEFKKEGQNLVIGSLTLVHESGNSYKGIAEATLDGEKIQLDVSVLCDGNNLQAEWEPTAAYQRKALNDALEKAQKEADKSQKEFEEEMNKAQKEFEEAMDDIQDDLDEEYDYDEY